MPTIDTIERRKAAWLAEADELESLGYFRAARNLRIDARDGLTDSERADMRRSARKAQAQRDRELWAW